MLNTVNVSGFVAVQAASLLLNCHPLLHAMYIWKKNKFCSLGLSSLPWFGEKSVMCLWWWFSP